MKTIKSKMDRLGHICRGIINVGLRKNIKIKGGVVKKSISCRYAFPTIPLVLFVSFSYEYGTYVFPTKRSDVRDTGVSDLLAKLILQS